MFIIILLYVYIRFYIYIYHYTYIYTYCVCTRLCVPKKLRNSAAVLLGAFPVPSRLGRTTRTFKPRALRSWTKCHWDAKRLVDLMLKHKLLIIF